MSTRRVVTGTHNGKSVVVSDEQVSPITVSLLPGTEFQSLWGGDELVTLPATGVQPSTAGWFPPTGGFRFAMFTLPPADAGPATSFDFDAAVREFGEKLPGMAEVMELDSPGMHTTSTVDLDFVVSGEVWLELDDGKETRLGPGDCVTQNGTRHAWRNKSDAPCVLVVAIVGAKPQS